ncbi:uncharacterized protein UTRI_05927_B [Ustilago trichophora]|uniref:Uncharacterized protein n=1 Tax=Ustilago trichophora TaxID=86804 RepID=A0A5C3EKV4_9BASI|nr:uncharacterized protein UTRI_05927_B [Ustilago trichophora]
MNRLQPASYGTSAVRSFSAGSHGSSNGSASSSNSAQEGAHTPSTSPSLSDRGASFSHPSSWNKLPRARQPSPPQPGAGSTAGLSPLELLVKRGKQVQHDMLEPNDPNSATFDASNHRIYERASALSRKTSVRKPPVQPSPDPDDFDDSQSIRSVNLMSEDGSSFSRSQRSASSSSASSPTPGSSFTVERGYKASYDDSRDSYTPTQPEAGWQRQSSHLLSNAFRNSVASDISFNSITGDALDASLSRRASIDTVRSSEFGEDGRWGRAWASRADDEESAYEESTYGDDQNEDVDGEHCGAIDYSIDLDPSRVPLASSGGLASVAKQWKLDHASHAPPSGSRSLNRNANPSSSSAASIPAIREVASKEKVVSLTRSVPPPVNNSRLQQPTFPHGHADARHSFVPQIEMQDYDAEPESAQLYDRTPMASADRYLGHRSTSSTSTITDDGGRQCNDSPPTARVYVYPPSPSGSEASRVSGGEQRNSMPVRPGQQRYVSMPTPASAQVETMSPQQSAAAGELKRTPLAPSSLLTNPRSASAGALGSHRPRSSGHPAGRAPPPPPPTAPGVGAPGSEGPNPMGYSDPNQYFQGVDRPIIGRKRAEAIARADGRESMVSDLDVETLRLDGSSRRDSTSTIGSVMTSRMSIGSVAHDPLALQNAATWRDRSSVVPTQASPRNSTQPSVQAKASQSSFRSLQPVQDTYNPTPSNSRPPMLRNAKSSTALPSNQATSVDMQPTASAPPAGLGLNPNLSASKPRSSPAVDTRTGPSSAEDFLSQGITYHEQGDLARSAFYFERSARVDGGCVVGMCMFGMALREGWGARKDPVKGFTWIQKAAARAGEMMSTTSPKTDSELKAIKSELKLSVYELGKCFCYGWGVKMDKQMALEYFELAAKLGDADAQAEAGALYAAGKGCKKDLKKAAMYYRMAEEGGYDTVGLSWIHKDKYK